MATLKNLTINDSGTIKLPVGTTAQRTVAAGTIRFNSTLSLFEGYDGTVWTPLNTFQPGTTTIYTATPPGGVYPVPAGTRFINALIVAGGGGLCMGGGGGGGGVRYITNIPVTPGGTVAVSVGGGGAGGQMTATSIVETSSIAFKENVNPITNALDMVMQLAGVTYDRKDNKEHEAGLIAEDVYKILPDLVSLDADGKPHGIKYTKLGAYLLESIKTLNEEINSLKNKLKKD